MFLRWPDVFVNESQWVQKCKKHLTLGLIWVRPKLLLQRYWMIVRLCLEGISVYIFMVYVLKAGYLYMFLDTNAPDVGELSNDYDQLIDQKTV